MNIKWRLTLKLLLWLTCFGLILLSIAGIIFFWILNQLYDIEAERGFREAGLSKLVNTIRADGDNWIFDQDLIQGLEYNGGWLQRIDENGNVTDSFFTPTDVPDHYGPGELNAYWLGKASFPYVITIWIQEKKGVTHTLIYGQKKYNEELLAAIVQDSVISDSAIIFSEALSKELNAKHGWVQVLDYRGYELAASNKPEHAVTYYSAPDLTLRSFYPERYGAKLSFYYDENSKLTWLLNLPHSNNATSEKTIFYPEVKVLAIGIGSLVFSSMLLLIIMSYLFGNRIGSPVVHILNWIRLIDKEQFSNSVSNVISTNNSSHQNKKKKNYLIYKDVIDSLQSLTLTLRKNKQLQKETETMREEWIAGVSHDLKTPLSTIKGYAHMLETDNYEWSLEEIRSFAKVMLDKSAHMDELINDLNFHYEIKSLKSVPSTEVVEMNAYLDEVFHEVSKQYFYKDNTIHFIHHKESIYLSLYKPWFQRVINNLTANAFLHNDINTTLTVTISVNAQSEVILIMNDNGQGMDEHTVDRLFDRYFRGTNSERNSEGTGLGMAISKALLEALGATIQVESELGKGTIITMIWTQNKTRASS